MSYEYIRGFGADDDDDKFVLGVKVAGSQSGKRGRGGRRQQGGGRQQPQRSREERRARSQASCGGIECPEGLKSRYFIDNQENPIRLTELREGAENRGCSLLCEVGNSATYCCPSAQRAQEVVTDPFATDTTMLDTVATTIAERSATQPPDGVVLDEQNGSSPLKLVAILGVLGFGVTSFVGYMVFRRKSKRTKRKKGKS